jgi:hypothetical protein
MTSGYSVSIFQVIAGRERPEAQAARDVVRHRTRFGDLVEVADLAISLDSVGAFRAARHFRRIAVLLRDDHCGARTGYFAYSKRLGDPYCVFDPIDHGARQWNIPRWVVDERQVLLLIEDVVQVGFAFRQLSADRHERRQARAAERFMEGLILGEGLVVTLPCLQANQPSA